MTLNTYSISGDEPLIEISIVVFQLSMVMESINR
jgi:hypothetical protein